MHARAHTHTQHAQEQDRQLPSDILVQNTKQNNPRGLIRAPMRMLAIAQHCPCTQKRTHVHANMLTHAQVPGPKPFTHKLRYVHLCPYIPRHTQTSPH